ncbi:MAG: hypothetical protein BJ554DRAFT_2172 [Olpidium bornovanus]|uniref:FCH domain-containing protein n=1 Tax=Olpidium bornovanus TaxID=278681 RepID=A0A8H7ZQW8_9FUNG|nr:MAG: hypothetical protein BJ554DRAFT_2172 [Olpidium bornovanus]
MNGRTHHDIEDDEDEDDGGDAGAATAAGMCGADDEDRTFRVKRCGSRCHLLSAKRLGDDPPAGCRSAAAGAHRPHDQEALLQFLCDMDGGFSVLLGRAKLNMAAMKDVVGFLKRRAHLEEEYGRGMLKLVQSCSSAATEEGRADPGGASGAKGGGSYGEAWAALLRIHEAMGQNRVGFAAQISEIADDLFTAYKGADRSRKQLKDAGMKHEKAMQEADAALEKRGVGEVHPPEERRHPRERPQDAKAVRDHTDQFVQEPGGACEARKTGGGCQVQGGGGERDVQTSATPHKRAAGRIQPCAPAADPALGAGNDRRVGLRAAVPARQVRLLFRGGHDGRRHGA